jgi:glutamine phosphoribosylpyrophosphate amidotransferase
MHALIIGSGTEEKKIVELVSDAGASNFFTFIKLLPHSQILHAHSICDIYVSMNHLGNLSNANLEAIQSNDCMIISTPQESKGIDEVTASLLGESVITVPINQPDKLSDALNLN